jgi:cystathionine beta-lyase
MPEFALGPLRLVVEHRSVDGDGGPGLRVLRASDARELLRFDCFRRAPHWHVDPDGRDEMTSLDRFRDPVEWTIATLGRDLAGLLARAGWSDAPALEPAALARALAEVERAMRNPPVDFDALDLAMLRARHGEKWAHYPGDALPAWVADMDFPQAEPIRAELERMLASGDLGYPVNPTSKALPALFAARVGERFGWEVEPRQVEVMIDVVQGIYVGLETLSAPGDGVIAQTPVYAPFLNAVKETGRALARNPLVAGPRGWEIDFDELGRLARAPRNRILLFCNPHNPSGRAFSRAELERVAEIVVDGDLRVISDEIHADLVFAPSRHVPLASLGPEIAARTLTLMSATKAFNIAGLRLGVGHFGGGELRERFLSVPRHVRGGVNTMGLRATEAAWRWSQPWLDAVLEYLDGNRRFVERFVREQLPGVRHFPPQATYLAWLDFRELGLGARPAEFMLERARVALSEGESFGEEGRGFARLNFATSRALLAEILERMAKALDARTSG